MNSEPIPTLHSWRVLLLFLLGSALLTAAYCQAPLFYSNQNQYFLHGLARAGFGNLDEDWLANTADPTAPFSSLVAVTARHLPVATFYVYHAVLLAGYGAAMLALFVYLAGKESAQRRWPIFLVLFVAIHSALGRWLSYRLVGFDYPWFLQAGVAGQYVLGAMLQPSVFGVLLVMAVALFVHDRPMLAVFAIALAATMHATYLLPGALLTLGFMTAFLANRRAGAALGYGTLTLILVLPIVGFILFRFRPTTPETHATAQSLLANFRIPHHARPELWLDWVAILQISWIAIAVFLVRRTRLFWVLLVPLVLAGFLTGLQVYTGSSTLALLFPWRISAVLVPLATTVVLTRLVSLPSLPVEGALPRTLAVSAILLLAAAGVWISVTRQGFRSSDDELGVLKFVRQHHQPGEVYLLPVRVPDLAKTTRGSLSSDFKPLAEKKRDTRIIPVDLQRFRLHTGAPIHVDFKSIPYLDVEVLEWHERLLWAQKVQEAIAAGRLESALAEIRARGITHLILPGMGDLAGPGMDKVFDDGIYAIYRLTRSK